MNFKVRAGSNLSSKRVGIAGKIAGLIFGLLFAGVGGFFTYLVATAAWQAIDSFSWDTVTGQIESSSIAVSEENDSPFELQVKYQYLFRGKSYRSSRYSLSDSTFTKYSDAARALHSFRVGTRPTVYVNSSDPGQAILVRGRLWLVPLILFPLLFVAIGLFVIFSTFTQSSSPKEIISQSISESAKGRTLAGKWGTTIGMGFCSIFLVVGLLTFYAFFCRPMSLYLESKSWSPLVAVVEYSRVRSHSSDDGTTYSSDILYRYSFNGEEYKSNRFTFFSSSSSGYRAKRELVDAHPPGKKIDVYVNPRDPIEAVVERELSPSSFVGLFTLIFVLVGGLGMYGVWCAGRKKSEISGRDIERSVVEWETGSVSASGELLLETSSSTVTSICSSPACRDFLEWYYGVSIE